MEFSTNKQVRWRQFRAVANHILSRAAGPWGRTDRIGDLARAMEGAYAAGVVSHGKQTETEVVNGIVRWEAIPARAQDALQDMSYDIRRHARALRDGSLVALLEGACATGLKGRRTRMSLWRPHPDGFLLRAGDLRKTDRGWAATSVSALVRLGIFEEIELEDQSTGFAKLSPLGIDTVLAAIAAKHIFALDQL
jgi:hypothetical protein